MASTIKDFILKGCCLYFEGTPTPTNKAKFEIIGTRFTTLAGFKKTDIERINNFRTVENVRCFRPLTDKERNAIIKLKDEINLDYTLNENFIFILTKNFIQKQRLAISNITLEKLNANPLLCRAIRLNTPEEFVKFYTYSALSRSIVTSMGYLVQDFLLYSNSNVFDGKNYPKCHQLKWDIVIEGLNGVRNYIEVKSGPNDLDKEQILGYDIAINEMRAQGHKAFWGFTYGKRDVEYVSTSIMETYVEDWKEKTLIGTELWDYISENPNYHDILMSTIQETADAFLGEDSLVEQIDNKIESLLFEFEISYGDMDTFYNSLW